PDAAAGLYQAVPGGTATIRKNFAAESPQMAGNAMTDSIDDCSRPTAHWRRSIPSRRPAVPLVMGYPTRRSGPANPRRDNQTPRRWDPKPSTSGPPAPERDPTRRADHSAPNAGAPVRRSIGVADRILGA